MLRDLGESYKRLEEDKAFLLTQVQRLPVEKLSTNKNGKWSILQVIAHLITAERMSVQYMQKKMQGIDEAGDTGIWEELKMILLIISQRLPLKYKAPHVVLQQTTPTTSLQPLEDEWRQVRQELHALLEQIPPHQSKRKIYKHVVAGKLNALQALRFFHEHFLHHLPQINRQLKT